MASCGYCYASGANLVCGKCKKRRYCSKECQKDDWSCGHKHWCGIAGEVGHDFEIKDTGVTGKGLGVFALRNIKKNEIVIAERPLAEGNSRFDFSDEIFTEVFGIMEPKGGSVQEKFDRNCIKCNDQINRLYLYFSKINHHCQGNVMFTPFHKNGILVLASRDIQAGEELSYSYISHVEDDRSKLMSNWKIDCKCSACCGDSEFIAFWQHVSEVHGRLVVNLIQNKISTALSIYRELFALCEDSPYFHVVDLGQLYFQATKLGFDRRVTLEFARKALECQRVIYGNHKFSDKCGDIPELLGVLSGTTY